MDVSLNETALARLRPALVKQARGQLGDEHEAEDVAQDALMALCTTTTCFADIDHVTAYARRTVHNLCVDRVRRRIRHVALEQAEDSYDTLEQDFVSRDEIAAVMAALAQINPAYAQVLIASTDVGRNHAAIAAVTGVSLRNVRHGLDRGTKALKAKLAAAGHSIPAVLLPLPIKTLLATLKATTRNNRTRTVGGAAAAAIPALLLLVPQLIHPGDTPSITSMVPNHPAVTITTTATTEAALGSQLDRLARLLDSVNDRAFAADAAKLLGSTDKLSDDECVLVEGHGVCQSDPDPGWRYYTINVPDNPILPDVQVWGDWMPPCDSTVPTNVVVTCEPAHPSVPFPVPTPTLGIHP